MSYNEIFMSRALALAMRAQRLVAPNPMVGAVITHNNLIIGEGWHRQYGHPHAEVNAINQVTDKKLLTQSTMYVTLEPCAHYGQTPPCVDLILTHKIPKVIICNKDPNPVVAGKGINILQENGVQVEQGVLEDQGYNLNRRFFTYHSKKRPYIILKWAESKDGYIADDEGNSKWISGQLSRTLVHQWRAEEAAIVVGTNTALKDNPFLTVRDWMGKSPTRILIDKNLKVPNHFNLFNNDAKTIIYNQLTTQTYENLEWVKLDFSKSIISAILHDLYLKKIQSVLVEGGSQLINSFLNEEIWDEIRQFKSSNKEFTHGISAPIPKGYLFNEQVLENDNLRCYSNYLS